MAQGVPLNVRVPLTELPPWVSFPVPVAVTANTADVAVKVQLPLMFAEEGELAPPQALNKQSVAVQIRRGVFTSTFPDKLQNESLTNQLEGTRRR